MVNKKDSAILGIAFTIAVCFIASRLWNSKTKKSENLTYNKGIVAFKEKDYEAALTHFLAIQSPDHDTLYMISQCYINLGNPLNALKYIDKCIQMHKSKIPNETLEGNIIESEQIENDNEKEINIKSKLDMEDDESSKDQGDSSVHSQKSTDHYKTVPQSINNKSIEDLVQLKFKIHNSIGMEREAFKDLFLVNLLNNNSTNKEKANEFLKKICLNLSKVHKIEGMASPINFSDLFDTFLFLKDEQDPAIVFINSKEFEKCYHYVFESELPLHKFLLSCFYICNGDQQSALNILEKLDLNYARILIKFIKAKKLKNDAIEDLKRQIKTETDSTCLLYISKIFESIGDTKHQFEALQACISIFPNAPAYSSLIVLYIKQKNHSKAISLLKTALKEFPDSINLVCIALEYFLLLKEIEEATKIMEMSEKLFPEDPRLYLFKYMISEVLGKPDVNYLKKGISIDPKYFKMYIYYGNVCSSGEESEKAYKTALACARSFDEIFAAYQLLVVVETQNELVKEFPELFSY